VDAPAGEVSDGDAPTASKKPVEVTAEDLADEEWGPVKEKVKKGKKGKGKKAKAQDESEDEAKIGTPGNSTFLVDFDFGVH
jgi:translation initiation factor 5B